MANSGRIFTFNYPDYAKHPNVYAQMCVNIDL